MTDDPLWYKDAIIYQMHVKAFYDANGDGIGDFAGLTQKLDYIQELGVNTSGCCRSIRRRCATTATTSPITLMCTPTTARWMTSATSSTKPTAAG
jgi:hypothetical protein